MSKISFFRDDITYGKYVGGEDEPSAIMVPQGKYTHLLYGIVLVPEHSEDSADGMREAMPEHYEADRIELLGKPSYDDIVKAIIGEKYSADAELSVINNHLINPTGAHEADFAEYQQWRGMAKKVAKEALGIPVTDAEIIAEKVAEIDAETDRKILRGHAWNGTPVWLSSENQFNFKAAFDVALQTQGANLPITYKLGEKDGNSIYHTFETVAELQDFYLSCVSYINQCLKDGWQAKELAKQLNA